MHLYYCAVFIEKIPHLWTHVVHTCVVQGSALQSLEAYMG